MLVGSIGGAGQLRLEDRNGIYARLPFASSDGGFFSAMQVIHRPRGGRAPQLCAPAAALIRDLTMTPTTEPASSYPASDATLAEFRDAGALLQGHFILSSGLHSPLFLQKMRVFEDPVRTARLCARLAARIAHAFGPVDLIVSPAIGGIIPGYETARALGCRAMFVEREAGRFQLRRGFAIPAGARYVIVEDIVTTGLSGRECVEALRGHPGALVGAACVVDRSGGRADVGVPLVALCTLDVPAYPADALPPELAAIPATKPGSRDLAA